MPRSALKPIAGALLVSLIGGLIGLGAHPGRLSAQAGMASRRATIELWEPAYTGFLRLPGDDIAIALESGEDQRLWLAADTTVTSFADGVWSVPEAPPGVSLIFTLAAAGDTLWAFGLDGGVWQRRTGSWSQVPAPLVADMYASAASGPGEAWAVGFDYTEETGVVFHATGAGSRASVEALTGPWLRHHALHAVAVDPLGSLWIGGCDYASRPDAKTPYLAYLGTEGDFHPVDLPLADGCVYDLAFGASGQGLAALGSDLLTWRADPGASPQAAPAPWQAVGLPPPEGSQWVRVAPVDPSASGDPAEAPPPTAWAIAGLPRWNGFSGGRTPWYFDGTRWAEATVGDLGPGMPGNGVDPDSPPPYLGLVTSGGRTWSLTQSQAGSSALDARAMLLDLDAGEVRLAHPLLLPSTEGDIAAAGDRLWVGTSLGSAPFLEHGTSGWQPIARALTGPGQRLSIGRIDLAPDGSGWALGAVRGGGAGARRQGWRFDGRAWRAAAAPSIERGPVQLRALSGGLAWSLVSRVDGQSGLHAFDGQAWVPLAGAPSVAPPPTPVPPVLQSANYPAVRAPFDALGADRARIGWLAAGPQALFRVLDGQFEPLAAAPRGQITDLELTGPRSGWAIGVDPRRAVNRADPPTGVVLRLQDGVWRELPLLTDARLRPFLPARGITDVHWLLLAAVDADEAWLYGYLETERQGLRVLVGIGRARPPIVLACNANVLALAADAVSDATGQQIGTDLWLLAEGPCGTPADPRLSPRLPGNAGPNPAYLPNHAGPVGRLRIRTVVDQVYLPDVRGGGS